MPDRVDELSILAKKYGIYHLVNNAYGIWCSKIANFIKEGMRQGECTVVIQSTDKNFMVPVGGAFLFAQQPELLDKSIKFLMQFLQSILEEPAAVPSLISSSPSYQWANRP